MRRGAKPAKAKVEAKLPAGRKSRKNGGSKVHDLEKRLAEALNREAEGRGRRLDLHVHDSGASRRVGMLRHPLLLGWF